jgi:hypothetical protein
MDYIPLVTHEYTLAFLQATEPLCSDVQRIIWHKILYDEDRELITPPAPIKKEKCFPIYYRTSGSCLPRNLFSDNHH